MGTGIGLGSEAGHSIFRGVFGNQNSNNVEIKQQNFTCQEITKLYHNCLMTNSFEQDKCNFLKEDINKLCKL